MWGRECTRTPDFTPLGEFMIFTHSLYIHYIICQSYDYVHGLMTGLFARISPTDLSWTYLIKHLTDIEITPQDVSKKLSKLKTDKSLTSDQIHPRAGKRRPPPNFRSHNTDIQHTTYNRNITHILGNREYNRYSGL